MHFSGCCKSDISQQAFLNNWAVCLRERRDARLSLGFVYEASDQFSRQMEMSFLNEAQIPRAQ